MIKEILDKHSGAIIFKKDEDSLTIERLAKEIEELKKKNSKLEKRMKTLENKIE